MIRITQQDSAKDAKRYYATADYYSEGQELVGLWGGKGALRLGLEGTVDKFSFERLCDNLNPRTGEPLTVRTRADRTVGYDFTFSVPKSVSLLYAMSGDQDILGAFRGAVDETMREMEAEMKTRVRRGRKDEDRTTGSMVWAEFIHTTSRPVEGVPDPQLHGHVFVFNTTWDQEEERWKAGQFRELTIAVNLPLGSSACFLSSRFLSGCFLMMSLARPSASGWIFTATFSMGESPPPASRLRL
jgi:conjugative relaxase-like TrwC/TraI family protein